MKTISRVLASAAVAAALLSPTVGSAQTWANWTAFGAGTMSGTLGATSISFAGTYDGYQLSDGVTRSGSVTSSGSPCNFAFYTCRTLPYTSAGVSAPTNDGFIQWTNVGRGTITFGSAVTNPLIAFISVGNGGTGVSYDFFGNSFTVLSDNTVNTAAWGTGTHTEAGNVLTGKEYSGTIRLNGTFNSFSFEVLNPENWHGITVGVEQVGTTVTPEPSTYALMGAGLLAVGFAARRRRNA